MQLNALSIANDYENDAEIIRELEANPETFTPDMLRALATRLDTIEDLKREIDTAYDEATAAEGRADAIAEERDKLQGQLDELTDALNEAAADLETVTQERDEFERQLDRALAK